jgi:carboxypeptidase Q
MQRREGLVALAALSTLGAGATGCAGGAVPSAELQALAARGVYPMADLAQAIALREAGLADRQALRLLTELCTQIGARPAGSAADRASQAWAQRSLSALGLEATRAESFALNVWQRGPAQARLVAPQSRPLVMAALGNSIGTPAGGIEAELAYYPNLAALLAEPATPEGSRARGRIVFIDQKTERTRDGAGYGRAVTARINGAVEASRRGALALAIRSIGTSGLGASAATPVAHTGAMRYDLSVPPIPAFAVSVPDAEAIAALHAQGAAPRVSVAFETRTGVPAESANVIAEWRGTERADEIVMLSAHLDSWDVGQGAQDDGAGVAIVCAAAGLIARSGRRARRTIRVVLFGNEENGFDGARHYGDRYKDVPHQLLSESDFGAGRVWQMRSRVQAAALPAFDTLAAVLAPLGIGRPEAGRNEGNPGPDAALLMRRHRWPAIGLSQDGSGYFDVHHTAHDTLDRLDTSGLPQNVAAWAATAWLAAQAPMAFGPPAL